MDIRKADISSKQLANFALVPGSNWVQQFWKGE